MCHPEFFLKMINPVFHALCEMNEQKSPIFAHSFHTKHGKRDLSFLEKSLGRFILHSNHGKMLQIFSICNCLLNVHRSTSLPALRKYFSAQLLMQNIEALLICLRRERHYRSAKRLAQRFGSSQYARCTLHITSFAKQQGHVLQRSGEKPPALHFLAARQALPI